MIHNLTDHRLHVGDLKLDLSAHLHDSPVLGNELLRRNTESRSSNVDSLALIQPGEGDNLPWPSHSLHLPQSEYDEPVVLGESDHAPPVRKREGEAEEDVGKACYQPHDDQGHQRSLVSVV